MPKKFNDDTTLGEVREYLHEHGKKGVDCPACDRLVKIYDRKINGGIVMNLFPMYRFNLENPQDFLHVYSAIKADQGMNMEYSKLAWWNLIEKMAGKPEDKAKKSSGMWRITPKGIAFLRGQITIPERVSIYDNRIVGYSENHVNVREALGNKFDYEELMK